MITHPSPVLIARYATGDGALDEARVWAIEAHLEECPGCRARLADAVPSPTRELLDRVAVEVAAGVAAGPGPARRSRLRRTGVAARILPWFATAAGLILLAALFDLAFPRIPSLVLLLAPVAPLLPVAAAWSRRADPAWELLASVPRTGLVLLLRRTLAVLAAILPALAVAGGVTGHSPALWLLPCLAFTAAALAIGALVGVERAALGLAVAWSAAVVVPSLVGQRLPTILELSSWPGWAAVLAVLVAVLLIRAGAYRRLPVSRFDLST
ncbi:zf-HC2 domain-containing protein [Natronosporangium hydrolyticum]|uniref:Zf-HC2 domain-containing protein n=1 Tax=Natronosporangium hydrolyticum TaxID=2811111 RepID=A0A895Y5K6_9ACTN|nr:zf-HC2 domain-containing protein [Natronosporangium hydrolyticum]QSB12984.1 zf-HC2 domain-containing protein [Natronosporangium hydrolyticum]